jgi:hypothetical protein
MNIKNFFIHSFSLLAQRKRIKRKGSLSLGAALRSFPVFMPALGVLLKTIGSLKTRILYWVLKQLKLLFRSFFWCSAT